MLLILAAFLRLFLSANSISNANILILGMDKRDDWLEKTLTTDTILLTSLNFSTTTLNLVSLPRDLWDPLTKNKINEIYPDSLASQNSFDYIKNNFSRIYGQSIDRVLIIKTSDITKALELFEYVDVYNPIAFTDNQYPNPQYIKDPAHNPIYITVSYPQGWIRLDSNSLIPFLRSRKSLVAGSDLGRIARQQSLIDGIIFRLKSSQAIRDVQKLTQLYSFFHSLETDIDDKDLAVYLKSLQSPDLSINKINIPVGDDTNSLIYHPQSFPGKQWVYLLSDLTYNSLNNFIQTNLK